MSIAAVALTACGLAVLFWGTAKAAPFAFFGTPEERADMETGRHLMLLATAVLLGAALLVGARGGLGRALVIASPGVVAVAVVYAFPKTLLPWLPLLVLGVAALAASLAPVRE